MKETNKVILWICFTVIITVSLKYVPTYLVEERKLDQEERVLDIKERVFIKNGGVPTSMPAPAQPRQLPGQLL
jgi:hypothetical protein